MVYFSIFVPNWNFHGVVSTHIINFAIRISKSVIGGNIIFFKVPLSSFRVRRRSVG